jgi:hypothetical protein
LAVKTQRLIPASVGLLLLLLGLASALGGEQKEMGTPEAPPNAKAVVGSYYRGDGTGYNIYLTLGANGKYTAEWHGCLGKYGEASGQWTLADKRISFKPAKERDMMKGHLKNLDVLRYQGQWIFVPSKDREVYDKYGVSRYSCFQRSEKR